MQNTCRWCGDLPASGTRWPPRRSSQPSERAGSGGGRPGTVIRYQARKLPALSGGAASAGRLASEVDGDQAQLAGVALAALVGQPAVIRPGEHLGEPGWLAREAGRGPAELAAQDAGEDGAVEVDVDGLELTWGQREDPPRQAELACPVRGVLWALRRLRGRDVPGLTPPDRSPDGDPRPVPAG